MAKTPSTENDHFHVARWMDLLGGFIDRHRSAWIRLGHFETRLVGDVIAEVPIDRPIYVTGLARSASTILLELLAGNEEVATHRYRDYPPLFTPYLWNRWLDRVPKRAEKAAERAHKDGIAVTSESPEAFEEILWMAFFPHLHDPSRSAALDAATVNPEFERFYRDHIRKLLKVRGGRRYLAKGNYNVTRLPYLLKLFPDARFIIPVRDPLWHIASLMKQHALFVAGQRHNPRALAHLQRVGHFEFGLDRRPINTGDDKGISEVLSCWDNGREVAGWARYWTLIYGYLLDQLEENPRVAAATRVVRFEDLCARPRRAMMEIFKHCELSLSDALLDRAAALLRLPAYYAPRFTAEELKVIQQETGAVAARLGYEPPSLSQGRG